MNNQLRKIVLSCCIGVILYISACILISAIEPKMPNQGQGIQYVGVANQLDTIREYAFSSTIEDCEIFISLKGSNIEVSPANEFWRGLSKGLDDPIFSVKAKERGIPFNCKPSFKYVLGYVGNPPDPNIVYKLPFLPGHVTKVSQGYFSQTHRKGTESEYSVDFSEKEGTIICASREGTVSAIREDSNVGGDDTTWTTSANYVIIKHKDGSYANYSHLKQNGVFVKTGTKVKAGDLIGFSGNTGFSSGPHLHFSVYYVDKGHRIKSVPTLFSTKYGIVRSPAPGQIMQTL